MLLGEDVRSALATPRDERHCMNHPLLTSWAAGAVEVDT